MTDLLVNIDVDDLARAMAFYCAAFELKVGRRFGADAVELLGARCPIYLLAKPGGTQPFSFARQARAYDRHWSPVHLDFVVDDIDSALPRVVQAGARLEKPIETLKWGRIALLADPFGHGICLIQFIGRGYDEIAQP